MKPVTALPDSRKTLLVGSIPAPDAREAVELALNELGPTLMCIPDGETGPRRQWVTSIITGLREHPALVLKRDGRWSDYNDRPHYRVRRGATLDPDQLQLGYDEALRESQPVLNGLVSKHGLKAAVYQVGIASGFDLALMAFGLVGALRYRRAFNSAASREMRSIQSIVDNDDDNADDNDVDKDVVFQLEVPVELATVSRAPRALRPAMARWMAGVSVELAHMAPGGTKMGIHLCFGDLNHRAHLKAGATCAPAVELTNAIIARWPSHTSLTYVHIPLAAGEDPPSLAESYYAPLAKLSLPTDTRLVAGFVHEALPADQLRDVLTMVESAVGRRVDIAAPCGLGRRDAATARDLMRVSRLLTTA
ncbi:hypothetical protein [Mycobacterium deserti]|uniref:Uncharacterized protein n=1 Tax=Mycobacterium deserti TaxID=2978347 RepID=A0ABT2MFG5_9MYCO|nr:hypothetical protein [Mycobacterium deserti]MCT7660701.1 hypothetical protein [Mycobacterium deserti]